MERYEKLRTLGKGAFGEVSLARDRDTGIQVARKKFFMSTNNEGIGLSTIREIKHLGELEHPNVIGLLDCFVKKKNAYTILELAPYGLERQDYSNIALLKSVIQQMLAGVSYLHANWIIHRDLKPGNVLIAPSGVVKITDFGLARTFGSPRKQMTRDICTVWYRAPEVLFGSDHYSAPIDIWSIGWIMAELILGMPMFPGENSFDQASKVFNTLGTPSEEEWPGMNYLPHYMRFNESPKLSFDKKFPSISETGRDLLKQMLTYNPNFRVTANAALSHPWFSEMPLPLGPQEITLLLV